jgi:hypothetical protein
MLFVLPTRVVTTVGQPRKKGIEMKRNRLLQALLVGSLATLAAGAGAQTQNATPREPTPAQVQPQNGSPVGTTPPMTAPSINSQQSWQTTPGSPAQATSEQARSYLAARQACDALPILQQGACNDDVSSRFSSIDAKCQKLSGAALIDCVHGDDHGG